MLAALLVGTVPTGDSGIEGSYEQLVERTQNMSLITSWERLHSAGVVAKVRDSSA